MPTIELHDVSKQFGDRLVLEGVSLALHTGRIVGVVGPNGSGKTTLLRLIVGELTPDSGTVTVSRGLRVGYLPQEPNTGQTRTLNDELLDAFAEPRALERRLQELSEQIAAQSGGPQLDILLREYDRVSARFAAAGGYAYEQRVNEVLGGLGFSAPDRDRPLATLSGGQRCRAALARLLLQENSYLLLDEPTNHLDLDAVRWLEKFLAGWRSGAAIISHDRYLLDRLAEAIIEVDDGRVGYFPGNYSNYLKARHLRTVTRRRQDQQHQAFVEKQREFIARNLIGQRARQALSRRKQLLRRSARQESAGNRPTEPGRPRIDFAAVPGSDSAHPARPRIIVSVQDLAKHFGENRLFEQLSFKVDAGERLGITGPNGSGKTTLLRLILGELPPDAGRVELNPRARVGYCPQQADDLPAERTVLEHVVSACPKLDERRARSFLARFLFRGEDVFKRVGELSGGEQSRLRLALLILAAPDVLILDEPTNHLDIPAREALETALGNFTGTIIAVSHDRYFLDRVVSRLLVLRPEGHALCVGNYSDYLRRLEQQPDPDSVARRRPRQRPRMKAQAAARRGRRQRPVFEQMSLDELETFIIEREQRLKEFETAFADPKVYRQSEAISALVAEFEQLKRELKAAEAAWERRVAEL